MKKTILLFTFLSFVSCNKNEENLDTYSYTFKKNSTLKITSNDALYMKYGIVEKGENVVFEYRFDAHDDKEIADDEYSETIRFEIDANLNKFSYLNEELETSKVVFTKYCFCSFENDITKNVNPTGKISGKKTSKNQWEIDLDITFYGNENKKIKKTFKLK